MLYIHCKRRTLFIIKCKIILNSYANSLNTGLEIIFVCHHFAWKWQKILHIYTVEKLENVFIHLFKKERNEFSEPQKKYFSFLFRVFMIAEKLSIKISEVGSTPTYNTDKYSSSCNYQTKQVNLHCKKIHSSQSISLKFYR